MKKGLILLLIVLLLTGCGGEGGSSKQSETIDYPKSKSYTKEEVFHNVYDDFSDCIDGDVAYISTCSTSDGYIGVCLKKEIDSKVKLMIIKDDAKYTYDVNSTDMIAYPLQMGSGTYQIKVLRNIEGKEYAVLYNSKINVELNEDNITYLYPNQIVDYDLSDKVIDLSFDIVKNDEDDLSRAYHLYKYVMDALDYDNDKAKNVVDVNTLPDLELALNNRKGICFDYASLLSALCRVQHIPARVIVGYTDIAYHAWCEIYLGNEGWVNPKFYFNDDEWSLVDPTFDDSGQDYEGAYDEVYRY